MQIDKAAADTKKYLKENPDSQTVIFSEGTGAVYVNADIGLIFKKNAGNMSSLLSDENAADRKCCLFTPSSSLHIAFLHITNIIAAFAVFQMTGFAEGTGRNGVRPALQRYIALHPVPDRV